MREFYSKLDKINLITLFKEIYWLNLHVPTVTSAFPKNS